MRHLPLVACVVSSLLAAGCALIQPVKDQSRFFVLRALPVDAAPSEPMPAARGLILGIGPVRLPDYLKQTELVEGLAGSEVRYSQTDRWAQPLETMTGAVVAQQLTDLLGIPGIVPYPWTGLVLPDYTIPIRVTRFENDGSGTVIFDGGWGLHETKTKRIVRVVQFRVTERVQTPDANGTVAAMSAALSQLSHEIAVAIRQVAAQ